MGIDLREHIDFGRWRRLATAYGPIVLLVAITLAVYGRVLGFEAIFGWDDELYLFRRIEAVDWGAASWRQRLLTPKLGYPVPVPTFLYYLTWQIPEGGRLAAMHGLNLAAHLGAVWAVWWLARRWAASRWTAWFVAAFWAAHPLLVETVAWLTNLKTALLGASAFGAIALWEKYLDEPSTGLAVGAVAVGLVGFGCRPEAVVLGPVLLVLTWIRGDRALGTAKFWGPPAVLVAVAAVYVPTAVVGQFTALADSNAEGALHLGAGERVQRVVAALGLQVRHVVWPVDLAPIYDSNTVIASLDLWLGAGVGVVLVAATGGAFGRRSPSRRGWVVWWAFYLPASGVVFLPRFTADTYMYVPLFGLVAAVALAVETGEPVSRRFRRAAAVGVAAAVVGTTVVSLDYVQRWRNAETLTAPMVDGPRADGKAVAILVHHYAEYGQWEQARDVVVEHTDAMYEDGELSVDVLKALARTGDERRAVRLGLQMLSDDYVGRSKANVAPFVVWTAAKSKVELPADEAFRAGFRRAARKALPFFRRQGTAERLAVKARYFADYGWTELAARYAAEVVRRDASRCEMWRLLDGAGRVEAPEGVRRPNVCR